MRALLPSFTIEAPRSAGWRATVLALALAAAASVVPWLAALAREAEGGGAGLLGRLGPLGVPGLGLIAAALLALGISAARVAAPPLRWTGRGWLQVGAGDASPVRVRLAVDLGGWMLLHVRSAAPARRAAWLPLAASGFAPGDWHALRCAVHAGGLHDG